MRLSPPTGRQAVTGAALLALVACARIGSPMGGPEDKVAPQLLATVPDSLGAYPGWHQDVEFRFDEVVSEGGSPSMGLGTGDLEKLILLSPSNRVPVIHWKRSRITVRPREGWKRDRVYRIELLPGISDLRRNKSDTSVVLTFSTGDAVPTDTLRGTVIDWVAGRPARQALLELVLTPDSLVYRGVSDSTGRFAIGPLPRGAWSITGAIDQNKNLKRDRRENWDSTAVAAGVLAVPTLWLIPRDTVGPKITTLAPVDSLSATVTFSQPLDPRQRFDSVDATLRRQEDSTVVPFRSLLPKPVDDSLQQLVRARADSIRADSARAADSTAGRTRPALPARTEPATPGAAPKAPVDSAMNAILASRPALFDKLVLRVDSAFTPDARYILEVRGIRSAAGVAGDSRNVLAIPKPPPPAAKDTTAAAGDSTRTPPPAPPPAPNR